MKTTKKLIMPIISLLMTSVVLVIAITYAWFAFNDRTTGNGMSITVKCTPNLIISPDNSSWDIDTYELSKGLIPADEGDNTIPKITATTHKSDSPTGLGYLRNSFSIDSTTGKLKGTSDEEIILDDVLGSEVNGRTYYVDYKVYVASSGEAFESTTNLVVRLNNTNESLPDVFKATSVDFHLSTDEEQSFTFMGTLNLDGVNSDNSGTAKTEVVLNVGEIPNYNESYFVIIMRCYFDGNLNNLSNNSRTYITSNEVRGLEENKVSLDVEIFTR